MGGRAQKPVRSRPLWETWQGDTGQNYYMSRAGVLHHNGRVKETVFSLGLWTLRWCLPTEGAVHHVSPTSAVVPHAAAPRSQEAAGEDFLEQLFGGRPCDHAATISSSALARGALDSVHRQWLDIPVMLQRRLRTVQTVHMTVEILQVPLLDWFLTCPLLCIARCHFTVVEVVDISNVAQRQFPLVLTIQKTMVDSPVAVH